MTTDGNILVVGTTADYIDWIELHDEAVTIFLTGKRERKKAVGRYRPPQREILADLNHFDDCLQSVQSYISSTQTRIVAVVCFDDESLVLAAVLAKELGLEFPSPEAVRQCLDKQAAKQVWQGCGVPCPNAISISSDLTECDGAGLPFPCVLKPHSGSGSERVFLCHTSAQARQAAMKIIAASKHGGKDTTAVAETFIDGDEFSCDFVVSDGVVRILRTAGKCMAPGAPLGTALAYILPADLPAGIRNKVLPSTLRKATEALGILHAICMVDFMVKDGEVFLLEISPRIGGDCLPHVLFDAWGIDPIVAAMDFARGAPVKPWLKETAPTVVGLRVFSPRPGKVVAVDTRRLDHDPRVISHHLDGCRGRTVVLPPKDYSSWLLGHVTFQPYTSKDTEEQIHELRERITVRFEDDAA